MSAAHHLAQSGAGLGANNAASQKAAAADDDEMPALEPAEEEGPIDETGLDPKEIELVMAQVNCSRAKAVKVLKENGGDIINASESSLIIPSIIDLIFLFSYGGDGLSSTRICMCCMLLSVSLVCILSLHVCQSKVLCLSPRLFFLAKTRCG